MIFVSRKFRDPFLLTINKETMSRHGEKMKIKGRKNGKREEDGGQKRKEKQRKGRKKID